MKTHTNILLVALALFASTQFSRAASIVWTNTAGGNWSDTNSWSPNQSPGSGDTAVVTNSGTYAITLDVNPSVGGLVLGAASGTQSLSISNGQVFNLTGAAQVGSNGHFTLLTGGVLGGNFKLNGALTASGGTLSGGLTVASNSTLSVSSPGLVLNSFTPGSSELTNYGTVNWSGGDINCDYSPQVWNYGLWLAQSDNTFAGQLNGGSGNGVFNNFGTFRKSGSTNITTIDADATFYGYGTVDVESGTVSIQRGVEQGVATNAANAFLSLGNRFVFTGNTAFSGPGLVGGSLIGSNAMFSGTLNCSNVVISGAITVNSNAVVNLGTAPISFNNGYASTGILTNYGTVNWSSDMSCDGSPQIDNYGNWNALTDNTIFGQSSSGTTAFNNYGTFRKSGSTNITTLDISTIFTSSGTVDVESGTVVLTKGAGIGATVIAGGATLAPGSTFTFTGSTVFSGSGIVDSFLNGSNAVFGGTMNFSGATVSGSLTIASNSVLNLGPLAVNLNSTSLTNYGTANWISGDLDCNNSPQVYNYGLWNAESDNTFVGETTGGTGNGVFNNFGTFRKSAGSNITLIDSDATFIGSGTVDVESGTISIQRGVDQGAASTATNSILSLGSRVVLTGTTAFSGLGLVEGSLNGSNAVFSGSLICSGVTLAGAITVASNTVVNLGTAADSLNNGYQGTGVLTNYGTVNWSSDLYCDGGPQIDNYGTWIVGSDNNLFGQQSYGITAFNNYGTFRKSGGTNITTLDASTIFTSSGAMDVESGTVVLTKGQASGTATIAGGATLAPGSTFTFTGSTVFSGSGIVDSFLNGSNAVFSGTLDCSGGTLSGTMTIVSNAVLNLGPLAVNLNSTSLTNYGTANWISGDLGCNNNPQVYNYGLWSAQSDNTFVGEVNGGSGNGVFNNFGTFRKFAGANITTFDSDATFIGSGTVDVESGTVSIYKGKITGTANTAANAVLSLNHLVVFGGSTAFSGTGLVEGSLNGSNAVFSGSLICSGVTLSGAITVASNSVVNLGTAADSLNNGYQNTGVLTNYGTVNWASDLHCDGSPQIDNYGIWNAQSDNNIFGQQTSGITTFNNYGTLHKSGTTGITTLDASTIFTNSGTVDVQSGTVSIEGTRSLAGGTLNFGIGSTNNFGRISFVGAVTLTGNLNVNLNNLYSPAVGTSFALLTYGSESGNFSSLNLPLLSAKYWTNNYGTTAFTLAVKSSAPPIPAPAITSGTNFSINWGALSGESYQVQFTTNLVPSNWINLGNVLSITTNGTLSASDLISTNAQRFYRIIMQ
jgi:hypothetical protein